MNLFGVVSAACSTVNKREWITIYPSIGYTINADFSRTPNTGQPVGLFAGIQAMEDTEVYMASGLDLSKETCNVYLPGSWHGAVRADSKGGDLIVRADGSNWLVTLIPENWGFDDGWTKCLITRQLNS